MAARPRARRRRTNMNRAHRTSLAASTLLVIIGVLSVVLGGYAWSLDRNPATAIPGDVAVRLGETPIFDAGVTLFVHEGDLEDARPDEWGCTVVTAEGRRALVQPGDVERTGTRVEDGEALVPALVIGQTSAEDRLTCTDLPEDVAAWSLSSDAGYPRVPMVLVVGGVALVGLSALVHPRTRGINRFR